MFYRVNVHFEGCISYEIDADNESEARQIAEDRFADEDERNIVSEIADVKACDSWEVD